MEINKAAAVYQLMELRKHFIKEIEKVNKVREFTYVELHGEDGNEKRSRYTINDKELCNDILNLIKDCYQDALTQTNKQLEEL